MYMYTDLFIFSFKPGLYLPVPVSNHVQVHEHVLHVHVHSCFLTTKSLWGSIAIDIGDIVAGITGVVGRPLRHRLRVVLHLWGGGRRGGEGRGGRGGRGGGEVERRRESIHVHVHVHCLECTQCTLGTSYKINDIITCVTIYSLHLRLGFTLSCIHLYVQLLNVHKWTVHIHVCTCSDVTLLYTCAHYHCANAKSSQ